MSWSYNTDIFSPDQTPMISFADRHGTLYFQYQGVTRRFAAGAAFSDALPVLLDWLKGGPVDGPPPDAGRRGLLSRVTRGRLGKAG